MSKDPTAAPTPPHVRRPRYRGSNPRGFHEKYKELNPERYAADVERVVASGKTPAGQHRPIMTDELLAVLRPEPGEVAVDCTVGGGGHALALLQRLQPAGRLIGLDVDGIELPRTEARLRAAGFGPGAFVAHHTNFAGLSKALTAEGLERADLVLADLGVSSMQLDNPDRGFSYKEDGPLDMRMNSARGESAAQLLGRLTESDLVLLLDENADEPHAAAIARSLAGQPCETTRVLAERIRQALSLAAPRLDSEDVSLSIRRTFQALRIAVNDEFSALEALLRHLPYVLGPGGRVAILSFHSGEDRRVKKSFQAGLREGVYSAVADEVRRPSADEVRANRRAASAKLRWAIRSAD